MHHCVLTYAKSCRRGNTSIWSLSATDADGPMVSVLTIAMEGGRAITQVRGRYNAMPGKYSKDVEANYASLMRRGTAVMQRWIKREKLVWGEAIL